MEFDAVDTRWGVSMVSTANLTSRAAPGSIPGRSSRNAADVANSGTVCYVRLVRFADTSIPTERLINEALRLIFDPRSDSSGFRERAKPGRQMA